MRYLGFRIINSFEKRFKKVNSSKVHYRSENLDLNIDTDDWDHRQEEDGDYSFC